MNRNKKNINYDPKKYGAQNLEDILVRKLLDLIFLHNGLNETVEELI